jgi:hypothetical protein
MKLYRYIAIDKNFDDIFNNKQLFFNHPSNFNDPFDCNIIFDTKASEEEIKQFILKNTDRRSYSQNSINEEIQKTINNRRRWKSIIENGKNKYLSKIGVCCFSKTNENPLLWAHYSTKHSGVCLVFEPSKDKTFFYKYSSVKYCFNYPIINFIHDENRYNELILTKSNDWIYEQEVRVIKNESGLYSFNQDCLEGLIFGCKCLKKDITRIKTLLINNKFNIQIQIAKLRQKSYGLDFVKI